MFDVVVANATAPRDGRFIEKLGTYNPNTVPASIVLHEDKALSWLMKGAQPTDTVRAILSYRGVLYKKHLQVGVNKGAITQEEADKKYEAWKSEKESKITGRVESLAKAKEQAAKSRLDAETKVNEARAAAIAAKQLVETPAEEAPAETEAAAVAEVSEAPAEVETTSAETETTAQAEETPAAE